MNQTKNGKEFEELFSKKLNEVLLKESVADTIRKSNLPSLPLVNDVQVESSCDGIDLTLQNLRRFHKLSTVPDSLLHHFKNGTCDLGE
jgi:hypothetical protein